MNDDEMSVYHAQKIGFIFQSFNLLPVLTAVENVELLLLMGGVKSKEAHKRSKEMLVTGELGDHLNHKPSKLSSGQRQRVTIVRSIVNVPSIIWADEPTGNFDTETSREIVDLLIKLNKENNQTFLVVTHGSKIGEKIDRIVWMESGKILEEKIGKELKLNS